MEQNIAAYRVPISMRIFSDGVPSGGKSDVGPVETCPQAAHFVNPPEGYSFMRLAMNTPNYESLVPCSTALLPCSTF